MSIVVVDSTWAWSVPIGGFVANLLLGGFAKSFGIIIGEFQTLFNAPTAYFTLAGGLIYTFMYILSLAAHLISEKIGVRILICTGGIGACISIVGAAYAPGILVWVLCIGVGLGISLSMIHAPVFITVGRAFVRQMGKANGLSVAGVSVGQMVFPYIVTFILNQYTVRGGCLVGGALMLHFLVAGALMPRHIVATKADRDKKIKHRAEKKALKKSLQVDKTLLSSEPSPPAESSKKDSQKRRSRTVSATSNGPAGSTTSSQHLSKKQLAVKKRSGRILHRSLFVTFVVLKVMADVADIALAIVLPVFGKTDCNFSDAQISLALSIAGGVDLATRLLVGWLSDRPGVRRSAILLVSYVLEALAALLFTFTGSSYAIFVLAFALFGACSGTAVTLMVVVLTDFVSPKNLPRSFALLMLVLGCFIGAGQFLIGFVKDATGNFQWSLLICFFLLLTASVLLCLEYPIRWWHARWELSLMQSLEEGPQPDLEDVEELQEFQQPMSAEDEEEVDVVEDELAQLHDYERSLARLSRATPKEIVTPHHDGL